MKGLCGEGVVMSGKDVVWCGVVWRGCSDEKARKIGFESARIGIN